MPGVEVTQYIRPYGTKSKQYIQMPDDIAEKAVRIRQAGYDITAEVLTTGEVSFAIEGPEKDEAIEICNNGPEVIETFAKLIKEFKTNV